MEYISPSQANPDFFFNNLSPPLRLGPFQLSVDSYLERVSLLYDEVQRQSPEIVFLTFDIRIYRPELVSYRKRYIAIPRSKRQIPINPHPSHHLLPHQCSQ